MSGDEAVLRCLCSRVDRLGKQQVRFFDGHRLYLVTVEADREQKKKGALMF